MTRTEIIDGGLGARTLATPHLALRWLVPEDAADLALYGGDALIRQKTETIPEPCDENSAHAWIAQSDRLRRVGGAFRFAITERETGELVGVCALALSETETDAAEAELGYWLGRPFWSKGYGREAVTALIAFGRDILHLKTIKAVVYAENTASVAVLRGRGFSETEYTLVDVPERGGKRLARLFSLELIAPAAPVPADAANVRVA